MDMLQKSLVPVSMPYLTTLHEVLMPGIGHRVDLILWYGDGAANRPEATGGAGTGDVATEQEQRASDGERSKTGVACC